ncbi:uncharacterized protein TM35_000231340 [Trypanosoma theileri]|uniref:MSP domain-containing protein n=1 Tax=Trypanosoma theileri TaxID=67003 RepID=A0A1X0NRQ1_9TRYP|nr:uncharacterized protein TM35_000231340 [Trypanosoma theileri]ORC87163.1 hypothetical protein TM35_000231340 [Trypanosoma theileri]
MPSTGVSKELVHFSQDFLYFPLPLTDVTIENIVQLRSLLPRTGNNGENVIAFKVLCSVRNRYSVRPSTGFILPGESVNIKFLLDAQQLRRNAANNKDGSAANALPDVNTHDDIVVDLVVVPRDQAIMYLQRQQNNNNNNSKGNTKESNNKANNNNNNNSNNNNVSNSNNSHSYMNSNNTPVCVEEAATFWKERGQVRADDIQATRRKLRCVYGEKNVPDSLVMRFSTEKLVSSEETPVINTPRRSSNNHNNHNNVNIDSLLLPPTVPRTRPHTNHMDLHRRTAPSAPPRSSPSASLSNREKTPSSVGPSSPSKSVGMNNSQAAAVGRTAGSPFAPRMDGGSNNYNTITNTNTTTTTTTASNNNNLFMSIGSGKEDKEDSFWHKYLYYKIPYPMLGVLLVLSFLCALFERGTLLSWLLIGQ